VDKPFHTIVQRRVSDEESVQTEMWHDDVTTAAADRDVVLQGLFDWRAKHNKAVMDIHEQQVRKLDALVEAKADTIHRLDTEIAEKEMALKVLAEKYDRKLKRVG